MLLTRLYGFWAIGVTIFEGLKIGVTIWLMNKHNPFFVGIHYMAHQCNLAMQTLSSLSLVAKIKALFFFLMYTYYSQFLKKHLERTKLAKVIKSKGLKFEEYQNEVDFHVAPFKRMFGEYETLVVNMSDDVANNVVANTNYELLCDVETIMGLTCVLPMLETMQSLSKLAQNRDAFICDFVLAMKLC
jgi:hypothetical protein